MGYGNERDISGGMSAVCSSRARVAAWGAVADGEAAGNEAVESGSPGRAVAGVAVERFLRWEGLAYQPQATAFPFVAAEGETNKQLP